MPVLTNRKTNKKVSALLAVMELDISSIKTDKDLEDFKNMSDEETREWLTKNAYNVKIFNSIRHLKSTYADNGRTPWQVVFGRFAGIWVEVLALCASMMAGVAFAADMWGFACCMILVSIYGMICAADILIRIKRDEKFWQWEDDIRKQISRLKQEEATNKSEVKTSGKRSTHKAKK